MTLAGDRCAGGIWRTGAHGTGATGAALEEAGAALRDATEAAAQAASAEAQCKAAWSRPVPPHRRLHRSAAERASALQAAQRGVPAGRLRPRRSHRRGGGPLRPAVTSSLPGAHGTWSAPLSCWRCCPSSRLPPPSKASVPWQNGRPAAVWRSAPAPLPRCAGTSRCAPPLSRNGGPFSADVSPRSSNAWPVTSQNEKRPPSGASASTQWPARSPASACCQRQAGHPGGHPQRLARDAPGGGRVAALCCRPARGVAAGTFGRRTPTLCGPGAGLSQRAGGGSDEGPPRGV